MNQTKPRISYWMIAGLGLIWNIMGCLNFLSQSNPEIVAQLPDAYQALIAARPAWATVAFGIAVFAGAVGCILLLLRRRVAVQLLMFSLIGVVLTLVDAVISVGFNPQVLIGTGASFIVAGLLYWMARLASTAGWMH